jgi:hypothetical protein
MTMAGKAAHLDVNGSSRSEHTCPGEMSKSWRLVKLAETCLEQMGFAVDILDLSRTTIRKTNPSLQVLRFDLNGALSLALQLLSELLAWPNRRLDERDLSVVGRGAGHHDRDTRELESRTDRTESDDRPAGLR